MSGDQVLENSLQIYDKSDDQKEIKQTTSFMVTVNGVKFQSHLNPNAMEFFPSYLQNKPQIKLNENLKKMVLKEVQKEKYNAMENQNERMLNEKDESLEREDTPIDHTESVRDNKNMNIKDDSINTNKKLYTLFAGPASVTLTSSEPEVSLIQNKEEKEEILNHCNHIVDIILNIVVKENQNEDVVIKEKHDDPVVKDKIEHKDRNLIKSKTSLKTEQKLGNKNKFELSKEKQNEDKNKNETKQRCSSGGGQQKVIANVKGKINLQSKITTSPHPNKAGTIGKLNASKITKNEIQKSVIQNPVTDKRYTISKCSNVSTSKPIGNNFKKEISKMSKNDAISTRSTTSTEKSSSSNKSATPVLGLKTKESTLRSPRATVSSKLRKTETQKRRNLFYDNDTIKMSDFLFK
ncbi:uncharacterized protein ACRADG_005446 [Cochliomyia hominivorax]